MHTLRLRHGDPGFPSDLCAIARIRPRPGEDPDLIPALYLRGRLPLRPGVAIVGSRQPPAEALEFASKLARSVGERGVPLWSGGAIGIDAAVHEAALAVGVPTVAVLPCGLERPYPPENAELFERVLARGGALVSLWPDRTPPAPMRFLQRNRVLAALTRVLVVACAALESGARNAAAAARRLGRPVCAVPHAPYSAVAGCAAELILGAIPVTTAEHVVRALDNPAQGILFARDVARLPPLGPSRAARLLDSSADGLSARLAPLGPDDALELVAPQPSVPDELPERILDLLGVAPRHVDEICSLTGENFSRTSCALLRLKLERRIVAEPGGRYRAAARVAPRVESIT